MKEFIVVSENPAIPSMQGFDTLKQAIDKAKQEAAENVPEKFTVYQAVRVITAEIGYSVESYHAQAVKEAS
jgi:hypothetical protein